MARVELRDTVLRNHAGTLVPAAGASVQVNVRGGGAATVYAAATGATTLTNPLTATAEGNIEGWVDEGSYDLVISGTRITTYTQRFEAVAGAAELATRVGVSVTDPVYGADRTGTADASAAFNSALASATTVLVPEGTYRLDSTVTLAAGKSLRLSKGATLKRVAAATSTDPVVRLAGNNAALLGEGTVQSEKASPRGVVNIGPASLTASEVNINWPRVDDDITIWGTKANGNVGLCLDSTQPAGPAGFGAGSNYNGSIGACFIRNVGTGVQVNELCAAHTFGAIRFYEVGQYCYHIRGGAAGASENTYLGGFTHFSAGVTVIKCERALYNEFYGVQAEPGAGSRYYDIDTNCTAVKVIGRDNCPNASIDASTSSELLVNGALKVGGKSLTSPPAVRATMTAAQSIPDLTQTVIAWNAEDYDTAGMHDNATNNSRITAPVAGVYAIRAHLVFAGSATGFRDIRVRLNGTTEIAQESRNTVATGGNSTGISLALDYPLAAGDYIELRAYHNQGAAINAGGPNAGSLSMHRVGGTI